MALPQWHSRCHNMKWEGMPLYILIFAIGGMMFSLLTFLIAFFHPGLDYRTEGAPFVPIDSPEFMRLVAILADSESHSDTSVEMLTNGDLLRSRTRRHPQARSSYICLEAYIFQKGEIASRFIEALTERARAGVEVRIVLDAVGSFNTWRSTFRDLIDAGGQVCWYIALSLVQPAAVQQPDAPRTADRRWRGRLSSAAPASPTTGRRRGGHASALARHHVPRGGPRGLEPAIHVRRKLAGILGRTAHRREVLSRSADAPGNIAAMVINSTPVVRTRHSRADALSTADRLRLAAAFT